MIFMIFLLVMGISLLAAARVKSTYLKYSQMASSAGLTGAEVAARILKNAGISNVEIVAQEGMLGDHYDPIHKRLVLSHENYFGTSPAAYGVSAHECGHALQDQQAYLPLKARMAAVGVTTYANQVVTILPLIGLVTGLIQGETFWIILASAWGIIMLFNLVTLPVEFDASARAVRVLNTLHLISDSEEETAVKKVLRAAAWTYVAAFITSLAYFLWHLLPLILGRRD